MSDGQSVENGNDTTTPATGADATAAATGAAAEGGKGAAAAAGAGEEGKGTEAGKEGAADGADKGKDGGKGAEAPADYTKLTMPEGYKTDDPVFADAVKLFESEKISPEQAQKLIDFTVKRDKEIAKAVNDASATAWTKQTGDWRKASEKEFSAEALGDAKAALAQVFDKDTVTYLESMGFTNHPGLIRGMVKVSQAIKDDTWVTGNARQVNGSDARKLFPNSKMNA